jgi:hypothetical protein
MARQMKTSRIFLTGSILLMLSAACSEKPSGSGNLPPDHPTSPSPADGATNIGVNRTLSWECSDPNGTNLTYDVYFGLSAHPPPVDSGLTANTYDPGGLEYDSTYHWKIVASDGVFETEGPLWTFTVRGQPEIVLRGSLELPARLGNIWVSDGYVYYSRVDLQIIDVMNPSAPSIANTLDGDEDVIFDEVFVRDDIMYVAAGWGGIFIYDVSDVYNPALTGNAQWEELSRAVTIFVDGNIACIGDDRGATTHVIDISDPSNPVPVSSTGQLLPAGNAKQIFVYENHAFVMMRNFMPPSYDEFAIVDMTDIENPEPVSILNPHTRGLDLHCYHHHMFVPSGNLFIFDISDPPNTFLSTEYETDHTAVDIFIQDDFGYLALIDSGAVVLDISNPESPEQIAELDLPEMMLRVVTEDNYVYLVDFWGTLYVLELVY